MIRGAYLDWMETVMRDAYDYPPLYHAVMAFSLGFMSKSCSIPNQSQHALDAGKHRYIAISQLQQELGKQSAEYVDPMLACSVILSWDVFFQEENIETYATLSRGLAAVLEKLHQSSLTTPAAACMTDALFQGIKAIQMPPYDTKFFHEIAHRVQSLREYYCAYDETLLDQCDKLIAFVASVEQFLVDNPTRNFSRSRSGNSYHDPRSMFKFVRRWMQIFPSEAMSTRRDPCLLYVYYHALTRTLDAIFPEVRYLFQFGFIGPVDLVGIENMISNKSHPDFVYPLKVLGFFKERLFLLNRLLIAKDPLEVNTESERIQEVPITSFEDVAISAGHYPSICNDTSPPLLGHDSEGSISGASESSSSVPQEREETPDPKGEKVMEIFKSYFYDRMEIINNVLA